MTAQIEWQSGQSRRQWHWTEKAKGIKTQSPNTSIQPNYSLMISQVVSIFCSFQKQSRTQMPVKAWYSHILIVIYPCFSAWRARKEKLSTNQKIIATLQAMNLMSKLPILGLSSLPTQKSKPSDPCECESTSSPKIRIPNLPLMQSKAATAIATRLTVDQRGQKFLTRAASWKSCTPLRLGKIPPNKSIIRIVRTVRRNPEIEQVNCGPLLGCGWPWTDFEGRKIEARQIQAQQAKQEAAVKVLGLLRQVSLSQFQSGSMSIIISRKSSEMLKNACYRVFLPVSDNIGQLMIRRAIIIGP